MIRSHKRVAFAALAFAVVVPALGCATRPDIVGHNDEAESWAESQRHEPKDKTKSWPGARPRSVEPARQPAGAEPAGERAPAPAK
jgi:hypothetical protein